MNRTPQISPDATATVYTTILPVLSGLAYRSTRLKLRHCMNALNIGEVSTAMAVSEFSTIYRELAEETELTCTIAAADRRVQISLSATTTPQAKQHLEPQLRHFTLVSKTLSDNECQLQMDRSYPLAMGANLHSAFQALDTKTAEETYYYSTRFEEALNSAKSELSSVQKDLMIAADIQLRMLPSKHALKTISPSLDCYALMVPCKDIGGDLYDLIQLDSEQFCIVVGDVSGKGVPASLMMATCITLVRAYCETYRSPSKILEKVNAKLLQGNEVECMFTTLFLAIINCKKHTLTYCNAGHNTSLIHKRDGSLLELDEIHGPALGVIEDPGYLESSVALEPDDRLFLYTDGANESFNSEGQLYGYERLCSFVKKTNHATTSRRFLTSLLLDLNLFAGTENAHDDITIFSLKIEPQAPSSTQELHAQAAVSTQGLDSIKQQVDGFCAAHQIDPMISARLLLVLDELIANTIMHGLPEATGHTGELQLQLSFHMGTLIVQLRDNTSPFNPFEATLPDTDLDLDERSEGGLGIFLVRSLTESFSYAYEAPWNIVRMLIDCASTPER